jgi:L-malate glycosyltransferase
LELFRRGVAIEVVTNRPSVHTREFEKAGIPVHFRHPEAKITLQGIWQLRKFIREGKFDIIHLFNSRAASNGAWASVGLPVKVVTYRGAGGLYWHDPFAWLSHLHPRIDRISCLSKYVQRQVDRQFIFRRKKTSVHYKAFLPEWFEGIRAANLQDEGIPADALVVGCVANYRKVKGIETLVRSTWLLQQNPRLHLMLVGRDMDNAGLRK